MTYKKFIEILLKSKYLSNYDFRTFEERYRIEHNGKIIVIGKDKEGDLVINLTNMNPTNCPYTYSINAITGITTIVVPLKKVNSQEDALKLILWMVDILKDDEKINNGGIFKRILTFIRNIFQLWKLRNIVEKQQI